MSDDPRHEHEHDRARNDDVTVVDDDRGSAGAGERPGGASGGRKLAEWVTLGASALLVLAVAAFLAYEATREDGPYVAAEVRPLLDRVQQHSGQFILPVEVRNRGYRTLQDFRGEVTYRARDGGGGATTDRREFRIDYLGEGATQTVYIYSTTDPTQLRVEARPLDYRLE